MSRRAKILGIVVAVLVVGTGSWAIAGLPGASSPTADEHVTKDVKGPNENAGTHPDERGQSEDAHGTEITAEHPEHPDNKGGDISELAHTTTAEGADKGAVICTAASEGKCKAGTHPDEGLTGDDQGENEDAGGPSATGLSHSAGHAHTH